MFQTPKSQPSDAEQQTLVEACARNAPIELHHETLGGRATVVKGRLLELTDGGDLIVALPPRKKGETEPPTLTVGSEAAAYFLADDDILNFRAKVEEVGLRVTLNSERTIEAARISRGSAVRPGQRRDAFRTILATGDRVELVAHAGHPDVVFAAPADARRFTGFLADASQGGLGVVLEGFRGGPPAIGSRLFIEFRLPTQIDGFHFLCEVRQGRLIQDGFAFRAGLRMLSDWPDRATHRLALKRLQEHTVELERERRRAVA